MASAAGPGPHGPLVGRSVELATLLAALDEAARGRTQLVLLLGEPGIGKTRLARTLCESAHERGISSAWGRAWESGGAPSYWPWREIFGAIEGPRLDDTSLGTDGDAARFERFQLVASFLEARAASDTLLLILDDLHAADLGSLDLLRFVARHVRTARLLLVGTLRDREVDRARDVRDSLATLQREGVTLPLGRLDRAAIHDFLDRFGGGTSEEIESAVISATQGHPLFLVELVRLLGATGGLRAAAGVSRLPVPHGVRETIRQRLAPLPPELSIALEIASVLDPSISAGLLAEVGGLDRDDTELRLAGLCERQVLAPRDEVSYAFDHALVREVVYRDLPLTRRHELHALAGNALERRPDARVEELARHFWSAGARHRERAVRYTLRCAERAATLGAFDDAIAELERARRALDGAGPARLVAELDLGLGRAHMQAGDVERGRIACLRAAEQARRQDDAVLLAEAALAYGAAIVPAMVMTELVTLIGEALERIGEQHPLRPRLMARLAAARQPEPPSFEGPIRLAREAFAAARALDDERLLLHVLHDGIAALMDLTDPRERRPLNEEAAALAERFGDLGRALRSRARLIIDCIELGDVAAARANAIAYERAVAPLRHPAHLWPAELFHSMLAMLEGNFAECDERIGRAARLIAEGRSQSAERCLTNHKVMLLRAREDVAGLRALLPALREQGASLSHPEIQGAFGILTVATRTGDADLAREALAMMRAVGYPSHLAGSETSGTILFAEALWVVEEKEEAARLLESARKKSGLWASHGLVAIACEGPIDCAIGLLAHTAGDPAQAARWFSGAVHQADRMGARPSGARARVFLAGVLSQLGRSTEARVRLDEAAATAHELGLAGLSLAIERSYVEIGASIPAPASPRPAAPDARTSAAAGAVFEMRRDGEMWRICWRGGSSFHLKDSKGLRILERLWRAPGVEFHAIDLMGASPDTKTLPGLEAIDAEAQRSYRRRVEDLEDTLREAEKLGDLGRAEKARGELDALAHELAQSVGLGGRRRTTASTQERARVAVQRRLRDAISRITAHSAELGAHLSWAVRTGTYCSYRSSPVPH
jgi:tetratricopeptide (TPR) repeat protein